MPASRWFDGAADERAHHGSSTPTVSSRRGLNPAPMTELTPGAMSAVFDRRPIAGCIVAMHVDEQRVVGPEETLDVESVAADGHGKGVEAECPARRQWF